MTFDQAYEKYATARNELRAAQSALAKAMAAKEAVDNDIKHLSKDYARLHRNLVAAQGALKPELDKEVASATKPERFEAQETGDDAPEPPAVALRNQSPIPGTEKPIDSKASIPRDDDPESIRKIAEDTALQEISRKQRAENENTPAEADNE